MLNIKNVTMKNFFSIGQVTETIRFENGTTSLVLGNVVLDNDQELRNGAGKAQPLTSKVRVPNGWTTLDNIDVGDLVCTPSGTHTLVVGKYPQGKKQIYQITMSDGRTTEACLEHLWKVSDDDGCEYVLSTEAIISRYKRRESTYIACNEEVYDNHIDVPIDPYLMGCFLAAGDFRGEGVEFVNIDRRIIDRIERRDNAINIAVSTSFKTALVNRNVFDTLKTQLFKLGLGETRCIPDQYKYASYEQKKELLMGIFDCLAEKVDKKSSIVLGEESDTLAKDIQALVRSMGGKCSVKYTVYSIRDKQKDPLLQKDIVIDSVFLNNNTYFSLEEKRDYLIRDGLFYKISNIKKSTVQEAVCIKVLSDDALYITDNYITTHNTTIANALQYVLYGKTISKVKKQDSIVNNINNKACLVTCDFDVNGKSYRIERGRKPTLLRFVRVDDDREIDILESLGENADTQKTINECLGITDTLFRYIIILNTYTEAFMNSAASKQREVIEELLGILVLSIKSDSISNKIKDHKKELEKEDVRIQTLVESNKRVERNIDNIKLSMDTWDTQSASTLLDLNESLISLNNIDIDQEIQNHTENKDKKDTTTKVDYIKKEKRSMETFKNKLMIELKSLYTQLDSFEKNICPTCEQDMEKDSHEQHKEKIESRLSSMIDDVDNYDKTIKEYNEVLDSMNIDLTIVKTFYKNLEDAYNHKSLIDGMCEKIIAKESEENPYTPQVNDLLLGDNGIQTIDYTTIESLEKEMRHYKFLQKLLTGRDSFIRKRIIDQSLPYLNKRLAYYIDKMNLPHYVQFDSDLTFLIETKGIEIDFGNLSRGEQNRTTFALNLAFRDLFENLVGPVNILFVDELLDFGIDAGGAAEGLNVMKTIARDKNKAAFLITHKEELQENVERILHVKKENDFTTFEEEY